MAHEAGKGSKQRPTDQQKFAENFERIFGQQPPEKLKRDSIWPFPPYPNTKDAGNKPPKFNPDNHEDAPL